MINVAFCRSIKVALYRSVTFVSPLNVITTLNVIPTVNVIKINSKCNNLPYRKCNTI